ncbi:MAG: hypothetical protein LM558_00560 [Thermosphaera sp.]|nr:hypothetical protein [Thermosphaera sp.]
MIETGYGVRVTHTGRVYRRYVELSRLAGVEPVTQDVLKNLAGMGILWVKATSLGRHGRTTVVKLLAPPQALCQELTEDLLVGEIAEEICRNASHPH